MEINFFTIYLLGCLISCLELTRVYRTQKFKDKWKEIQEGLYFFPDWLFDFIIVFIFLFFTVSSWAYIIFKLAPKKKEQ